MITTRNHERFGKCDVVVVLLRSYKKPIRFTQEGLSSCFSAICVPKYPPDLVPKNFTQKKFYFISSRKTNCNWPVSPPTPQKKLKFSLEMRYLGSRQ